MGFASHLHAITLQCARRRDAVNALIKTSRLLSAIERGKKMGKVTSVVKRETGPTLDNAYENIKALMTAAGISDYVYARNADAKEEYGYFEFYIVMRPNQHEPREWKCYVTMPGVSLHVLRAEILQSPRIYINDSSWWWKFAIDALKREACRS